MKRDPADIEVDVEVDVTSLGRAVIDRMTGPPNDAQPPRRGSEEPGADDGAAGLRVAGDVVIHDGRVDVDEAGEIDFLDDRISAVGFEHIAHADHRCRCDRTGTEPTAPAAGDLGGPGRALVTFEACQRRLVVQVLEVAGHDQDSTRRYRISTYDPAAVSVVCSRPSGSQPARS